jgi:hypothetical protein
VGALDAEVDAAPPPAEVCMLARNRPDHASYASIVLTTKNNLSFCARTECFELDVPSAKYSRTDRLSDDRAPSSPRYPTAFVKDDEVSVCSGSAPCKSFKVAGARASRTLDDPGTHADVDQNATLASVDLVKESVVYDLATAKVIRRFPHGSASSFCDSTCFFGPAFYCASARGSGFVDPRTGTFIGHLGGSPALHAPCPGFVAVSAPDRVPLSTKLDGDRWAFVSGGSIVIEDMSTHAAPRTIDLGSNQFPKMFVLPDKKLLVALTRKNLGDAVVIDWTSGEITKRATLPTCVPRPEPGCDVQLEPFTGPTTIKIDGSKTYCIGTVRIAGSQPPNPLPANCTFRSPTGAYVLTCPGFRAIGGGPIANLSDLEIYAPPDAH